MTGFAREATSILAPVVTAHAIVCGACFLGMVAILFVASH